MKHSTALPINILLSIIVATAFFLVSISFASAQTNIQLRPGTTDVDNIQSDRLLKRPDVKPVPTLYENTRDEQKEDEVHILQNSTDTQPKSFLDKARSVLKERRLGTDRVQENEEGRLEQKGEREETLKEQKKDRISKFLNNIKRKVDAAISRLLKLSERIESRITKFEERGVDMTDAKQLLDVAKTDIESAKESISTAVENAKEALSNEVSRNTFGGVVSELAKAKESLHNAHKSLVDVIRIMKANLSEEHDDDHDDDHEENSDDSEIDTTN